MIQKRCSSYVYRTILRKTTLSWNSLRYSSSGLGLWKEDLSTECKHSIEAHWRDKLYKQSFNESDVINKQYVLSMFPYPSGQLHMGHVRVYTISDAMARFYRMSGKNVLHPIGWDAFGLPAENAAIERNISAQSWTEQNIQNMKEQLQRLGCSFDWDREIATCKEDYYKWTQYLFLMLFKQGLAYRKHAVVNWDPVDNTVLADEQVDDNGCSWRSGAKVEKKLLNQWFIKTTKFAKNLLDGLDNPLLEDWKDIINLQKHWIGECNGHTIDFQLVNSPVANSITLWTKYIEKLDSATFIAVAPNSILDKLDEGSVSDAGYRKLNVQAKNPFNGEMLPIYVTDQIEYEAFCDTHIGLPFVSEIDAEFTKKVGLDIKDLDVKSDEEYMVIKKEMINKALELGVGGYETSSKLRDWLISRQRYWGTPIPIVYCDNCGTVPLPESDLPVELPELSSTVDKSSNPLLNHEWCKTSCPKCSGIARRETDTMDTFVDSSWYYLRYIDDKNINKPFDEVKAKNITPVDLYIGGKEHAVLHLYYARFMSHFLHSLGLIDQPEPFKRLLVQGMVMGQSFRIKGSGQYVAEDKVDVVDKKKGKAVMKETGEAVVMAWEKMSKSKKNGVDPQAMFNDYGTDTTRLLMLADVAPTSFRHWTTATFPGILNWQKRLWLTMRDFIENRSKDTEVDIYDPAFIEQELKLFDSRNFYAKGATFNYISSHQLSVAISKMQGLTNSIRRATLPVISQGLQYERALGCQILLLAPMAPYFASEMWAGFTSVPRLQTIQRDYGDKNEHMLYMQENEFNYDKSVFEQRWPDVDQHFNVDLSIKLNGDDHSVIKMPRFKLDVLEEKEALSLALNEPSVSEIISSLGLRGHRYLLHKGYEAELNLYTKTIVKRKKKRKSQM